MLGVFLHLAIIRPGRDCQDLYSPCGGVHLYIDSASVCLPIERVMFAAPWKWISLLT